MKTLLSPWLVMLLLTDLAVSQERRTFSISDNPLASPAPAEAEEQNAEAEDVAPSPPPRRTQWLMFTAEWCGPCHAARADLEPSLKRNGWQVDESPKAHIRLMDGDRHADLVQQRRIRAFPTFVLIQDGRELRRVEGYPGRRELIRHYNDAVKAAPPVVGAISVGTLKGQRDKIAKLISVLRPLLGTDGTITVRLDRPGTPSVVLPLGDRISIRSDSPLVMNYTLKDDVLTCRFAEPYPRGRFTFGVPVEQSISAVSFSVSEVVLELPHAPDVRLKVEP